MSVDLKTLRTIRGEIHRALPLDPEALRGVLDSLMVAGLENGRLLLHAPSRYARDKLIGHVHTQLLQAWQRRVPEICAVDIMVGRRGSATAAALPSFPGWENGSAPIVAPVPNAASAASSSAASKGLPDDAFDYAPPRNCDEKYTFETFIIGSANRAAAGAVHRLATQPEVPFNVLFLYGAPGLGKTHLMNAAVRHMLVHDRERRVLYLSAEQFMYRFVQALRRRDTDSFKDELRALDVLFIDDVQFLAGKEGTQEEFFHTFNALVDNGRRIVLSADRLPHRIDNLEDRIRSRLNGGAAIELLPPEPELRQRILRFKAQCMQRDYPQIARLPEEVFEFLANRIVSNVRELEGALHRIAARTALGGYRLTLESVREMLADMLSARGATLDADEVIDKTCERFGVARAVLLGGDRSRENVLARQTAMYLLRESAGLSYADIARLFGGKSHTTVMHAVRRTCEALAGDAAYRRRTEDLRRYFGRG